jgi:cytochrome c5
MREAIGKLSFCGKVAVVTPLVLGLFTSGIAQQAGGAPAKASKTPRNPVQEITLPQYSLELPPSPNLKVFENRCELCHSARYVTTQPRFPKAVWEKEVKKMVDVYGAPIPTDEQQQIVEYLMAIRGPVEDK